MYRNKARLEFEKANPDLKFKFDMSEVKVPDIPRQPYATSKGFENDVSRSMICMCHVQRYELICSLVTKTGHSFRRP
jgi:hypothetical protein